jgi:hypothetical protein
MDTTTRNKIRPEFRSAAAAGEVHVLDYFVAGSARGADHAAGDDVSCANCGSKIAHCFATDVGILGGDCAANITGDNSTRAAVRRYLPKLTAKIGNGRASKVWVAASGSDSAIWMQVRGTGYVREYDGAVVGARVECLAVVKPHVARMLVAAVADEINGDGYHTEIAA